MEEGKALDARVIRPVLEIFCMLTSIARFGDPSLTISHH